MAKLLIAAIIGAALGITASKLLFVGSGLTLIPWGLVGLAIGIFAKNKNESFTHGAIYGFVLSFIFMLSGYTGKAPVVTKLIPFAILGLIGAVCGLIASYIGYFIKSRLQNR